MLTEEQIKATIVQRLSVADGSANSHYLHAVGQQIRALVFVLGDGSSPPGFYKSVSEVCDASGIPYTLENGDVVFDKDWLNEHGMDDEAFANGTPVMQQFQCPRGTGW